VSACEEKRIRLYAFTSNIDGPDRGGSSALAGEQLHTDGGVNQVAVERRRGDRHGFVVAEHFRTLSLLVPDARWDVTEIEIDRGEEI
jgi:hypothetical protein